jgi:L-lactate dehydrogenase complex protein LldG
MLSEAQPVERFSTSLRALRAEPHVARDDTEASALLRSVLASHSATKVVVAPLPPGLRPLVERALDGTAARFLEGMGPEDVLAACASADVGITGAEYGIIDDGAIVEVATDDVARMAASLPIVHVALLSAGRLLRDVSEAMAAAGALLRSSPPGGRPTVTFISGPSRTGDIELRLLYGVHGPHSLHVILLDWSDGR